MENLLNFQQFTEKDQAIRTAATLEKKGIYVDVEENLGALDSNFIGQQFQSPYILKVRGSDFTRARSILMESTVINLEEVDEDYMLLQFSDDELIDVMSNIEDWGVYNYKLAEVLLRQRDVAIPFEQIEAAEQSRLEEKAKPSSFSIVWILLGYIVTFWGSGLYGYLQTSSFNFVVVPSFFALIIGWLLTFSKRTLPDGSRRFYFNRFARVNGGIIFVSSIVLYLIFIISVIKAMN